MNPLDDLLSDALTAARTDERWAVPVRPDVLDRLRRGRTARRRRTAVLTATGCLAVVGAAAALVSSLPSHRAQLSTFGSGGAPAGSPAPGITPAFVASSGRDWLLTPSEWSAYNSSHTHPSPGPGQSVVASPAPLGAQSAGLLADVQAAGLPAGTTMTREDAVGGQPGAAAVHVHLTGGVPVEISTIQAQEPLAYQSVGGPSVNSDATVVDVPGTTSAAALYPTFGYGFPDFDSVNAHGVIVATRGGVTTTWAAPSVVPLASLRDWALAAAQHAGD